MLCFVLVGLIVGVSVMAFPQRAARAQHKSADLVVVAVSRDDSALTGGISCCGPTTKPGTLIEKPVARLSLSGNWSELTGCNSENSATCGAFQRDFLSKPHIYRVVSDDGYGALVHVAPTTLSECYNYSEEGVYSGAAIENAAIAASSEEPFTSSAPPRALRDLDTKPILDAVASRIPGGLESRQFFKFYSLQLEGRKFVVVQRALEDFGNKPGVDSLKLVFAIGIVRGGHLKVLLAKHNAGDEDESVLGTIRLKSGREFLVTSMHDSEEQWFRVYGIINDKLAIVYTGGLSDC